MATAEMQNLNAPATKPGPLTASDLPQWRTDGVDIDAIHRRTGYGHPRAAEAATDVGQEDDLGAARGVVLCIPAVLLAWALIAAAAVTWKFWPF